MRVAAWAANSFGGRDKSIWAHDQYTELKTLWIDVPGRTGAAQEKRRAMCRIING